MRRQLLEKFDCHWKAGTTSCLRRGDLQQTEVESQIGEDKE